MSPSSSTTVENPPFCQTVPSDDPGPSRQWDSECPSYLCCGEIVDGTYCIGKSRFCRHLSSQREQLLLKLCDNLLHRHRHSRIVNSWISCSTSENCSLCISPAQTRQTRSSKLHGPPSVSAAKLSAAELPKAQLFTTQQETSNDHQTLRHASAASPSKQLQPTSRCHDDTL